MIERTVLSLPIEYPKKVIYEYPRKISFAIERAKVYCRQNENGTEREWNLKTRTKLVSGGPSILVCRQLM